MSAQGNVNLSLAIKEHLSAGVAAFLKMVGTIAEKRQQRLYLVGGMVRDLLLERPSTDLDFVVEGDAIKLAEEIGALIHAKVTTHVRFGTATLKWEKRRADFAMARSETYTRPGALPRVRPGTIKDDLARRDFTINAMAIDISPRHFGELIDPFGGRRDLDRRSIRVLHEDSFSDDATRIWRALRYEQRLDFEIEPMTTLLIGRDLVMLETISGDRVRHELELVLQEAEPEKALLRADELGVLSFLHASLKADGWLKDKFAAAREQCTTDCPHPHIYLALLFYRLSRAEAGQLMEYLNLSKAATQVIRDTLAVKANIRELSREGQPPSIIYNLLQGCGPLAYMANTIAVDSPVAIDHIELYESVLKHVHPALTGDDLKKLGVPRGPRMKEILQKLLEARLDGIVEDKQDEEKWVKGNML